MPLFEVVLCDVQSVMEHQPIGLSSIYVILVSRTEE